MDTELLIGLIGVGGTLAGTLVGTLSNYYLGERRENRKRTIEDWNKVVEEVYSPLIFDLRSIKDWGTLQTLRVMSKQIPALLEKYDKEEAVTLIPRLLELVRNDQNQTIEGMLRKNSRLIRPNTLWFDLFEFWDSLRFIERNLVMLSAAIVAGKLSKGLSGDLDKYIVALQSHARIGEKLSKGAEYLIDEMTRIAQMDEPPKSLSYKPFFTEDARKDIVRELENFPVF
ncbi:hypothetical protein MUP01_00700 [Candidatus Bathyarchaeota archaeon]|nr:hypothetical protein [Candidatus Bathyarchaeota archaeon]